MHTLWNAAIGALVISIGPCHAFDALQHLGGNSPWFQGPSIGISSDIPSGCTIDLAAAFSRHGSRFPDLGAYEQWSNLSARLHAQQITTKESSLAFLSTWQPVLTDPEQQIAQLSPTGYKELFDMGATYRLRYSNLYTYNTPMTMWANYYSASPRVRDSARLFSHGFLGPNATTLGSIYAVNSTDPASFMNSMATSDLCPNYVDNGGSPQIDTWNALYLKPILKRLNDAIEGGFKFTETDVSIIPYLCGFESQILGSRSPWCSIFTENEIIQYEYAQDLRYWYGSGLGTQINKSLMLPILEGLLTRFADGPNVTYKGADGSEFSPPKVTVAFTNDGQINQLAAAIGVFDNQEQLPSDRIPKDRLFRSSNFVTMRGTIGLERLVCSQKNQGEAIYIRIRLNDVVYPVANCHTGPGGSCPFSQYVSIVGKKLEHAGDFSTLCNATNSIVSNRTNSATIFKDVSLPFETVIKP